MKTDFCLVAVEEAQAKLGKPEIFKSDQGRQFSSGDFVALMLVKFM